MSPSRKILVPYDFDELSAAALGAAMDLGARSDRRLELLHVMATVADEASPGVTAVRASLRMLAPHADIVVRGGQAAPQIVAHADETQPTRIVMGTHQRSRLGRVWFGSVIATVCRQSLAPVMTVPLRAPTPAKVRIVDCAVDFGPGTAAAIELAHEHARDMDAALRLVHVVEPPPGVDGLRVEELAASRGKRLADLAECVRATTWMMIHGDPAAIIVATSRADLPLALVVAGRDPARSTWTSRSVTSSVIAASPVPILIAPARATYGWRTAVQSDAKESVAS